MSQLTRKDREIYEYIMNFSINDGCHYCLKPMRFYQRKEKRGLWDYNFAHKKCYNRFEQFKKQKYRKQRILDEF